MAKKRIKELAREHDMPAKEVIDRLVSAGLEVKGPASAVDEDQAKRALAGLPIEQTKRKEIKRPAVQQRIVRPSAQARAAADAEAREKARKEAAARPATGARALDPRRPTTGPSRPGSGPGGKRRVVIDSTAGRPGGIGGGPGRPGGPGGGNFPQRRPRRGGGRRRRADVIEETVDTLDMGAHRKTDIVKVASGSTVKDISEYFGISAAEIIKKLMMLGEMATLTQTLPDETIEVLAADFEKEIEIVRAGDEDAEAPEFEDDDDDLTIRPPVITIMGHVDHGKTSLLDAIRSADVTKGEAGGITQHIGAYQVHHADNVITFLDTPGHEAFTAMRARGARVTDIAVIVVAADDGVKPQTIEAIDHAKAADVPIVVAVNKIDKEGAEPERVRTEMTSRGIQPSEWGGDVEFVDVSAKSKKGIEDLLETLLVVADLQDIRANAEAEASGVVIESKLDPGRGPVATVLVQRGTLMVGDALVSGGHWGRVKAMQDYTGKRVEEAGPGDPVEVLGFNSVPDAGEFVQEAETDKEARVKAEERALRLRQESVARRAGRKQSLEDIFSKIQSGDAKQLALILKGDVAGSVEAFEDEIARLPQDEVAVDIVHSGVGGITESDVNLAAASNAIVIGFNVRPVGDAKNLADREGVDIRTYSIIYKALDDLKAAMTGLLEPEEVEDPLGTVEVRQIFKASKIGTIAGSYVTDGKITRGAKIRIVRDGMVVHEGEIESLRRFNEDAREVATGYECGIVVKNYSDVREGDILEAYTTRKVERELAART
ncbi:MAG: translation initiation factor IF-2 [Patulibacter sp.]|nr:translation initiation factor IF-2 [Patulibacter sp.]